jgi:PleD family two-component response regulator
MSRVADPARLERQRAVLPTPTVGEGVTSIEEVNRVLSGDVDGGQATRSAKTRALVADDEPITRMLVKLLLERDSYDVLGAANGRHAVARARRG